MEERHDQHCTVLGSEFVRVSDIQHRPGQVAMGERNCLRPSSSSTRMQHQSNVLALRLRHPLSPSLGELSLLFYIQNWRVSIQIAFCNSSSISPGCLDGWSIFCVGIPWDDHNRRGEVLNVELELGLFVCRIQRCRNSSLVGSCEERDNELIGVGQGYRHCIAMPDP